MKSYWYYTYLTTIGNELSYGYGVYANESQNVFNFIKFHLDNPKSVLLSVNKISEEQFNKLKELINNNHNETRDKI